MVDRHVANNQIDQLKCIGIDKFKSCRTERKCNFFFIFQFNPQNIFFSLTCTSIIVGPENLKFYLQTRKMFNLNTHFDIETQFIYNVNGYKKSFDHLKTNKVIELK